MLTSEASEAMWWRGLTTIRQLMGESRARRDSGLALSTCESDEERIAGYARLGKFLIHGREELFASADAAEVREPARAWRQEVDGELHDLAGALRSAAHRLEQLANDLERMRTRRE